MSEFSVARMIAVSSDAFIPGDVRTDDSAALRTDFSNDPESITA